MKFLAFVDLHQDINDRRIIQERIDENNPDFIVCAGDFTWFGDSTKEIIEDFNSFGKKVYLIHGNHENEEKTKKYCELYENIVFVHKQIIDIEGVLFVFFGGGGFSETEPTFKKLIKKNRELIQSYKKVVLITHAPPFETEIDAISEDWHVGVIDFKEFILEFKPILAISGHIHESYKRQQILGETLIINPGGDGEVFEI